MPHRPTILAVDHDPAVQAALRRRLVEAGYEVSLAANAVIAGCRLLQRPPHLMIIAAEMPEQDGIEFVSALVADCSMPNIPLIFLARSSQARLRAEALGAGCLALPFSGRRLLRMVEGLVGAGLPPESRTAYPRPRRQESITRL